MLRLSSLMALLLVLGVASTAAAAFNYADDPETYLIKIEALDKYDRSLIADLGVDIIEIHEDYVLALAHDWNVRKLEQRGFTVEDQPFNPIKAFPPADSLYHDYSEVGAELQQLAADYPQWCKLLTIGQSIEGRNIYLLRITANPSEDVTKPILWLMGEHHAREHMAVEVPLGLARLMVKNASAVPMLNYWLSTREVWVSPMINPDGAEYDIATGSYDYWRKNRRNNGDGSFGVDLNRNYSYQWGGPGSSGFTWDETYRGPSAFSEPETQVVRDWVAAHSEITSIVSYHSYAELVLYPWGYKYQGIGGDDEQIFSKLASAMADLTGYTAQQSSDLYLTSGDTTDWAYGEYGIYAFTIELYPINDYIGFYPPDEDIQKVLRHNWRAAGLMLWAADNPAKVLDYVPPGMPEWQIVD